MIESNRYTVFLILCICILASCARIGAPTGGPKDQTPPALQAEKSEANFQTNFSKRKFEFEFDEWIKLQNPIREVVVSPPTEYPVSVNERGKKIVFEFSENEVLKEDATYQINFGDAIKDFTEGNILKNFVFVFSTGDVIDSLSVKGKVKDVLTGAGEENILVVLYDDVSDTSFTTKKPFYFSKTDAEGNFELKNLRQDTFQIFALKDENVNYYYDLPREKVGFLDSLIITEELANQNIEIDLFDEEDPPRLVTYTQDKKGLIKANYSPMPQDFNVTFESNDTLKYFSEINKDTILIYHNVINSDSSLLFISYDDRIDTLKNKRSKTSFVSRALIIMR